MHCSLYLYRNFDGLTFSLHRLFEELLSFSLFYLFAFYITLTMPLPAPIITGSRATVSQ